MKLIRLETRMSLLIIFLVEILSTQQFSLSLASGNAAGVSVDESWMMRPQRMKRESPPLEVKNSTNSNHTAAANQSVSTGSGSTPANRSSPTANQTNRDTLYLPDRTPEGVSVKSYNETEEEEQSVKPGNGDFDDKAVQRTLIVIAGIAVIIVVYLGIKFALIRRRKVVKRYGRIEASEMDLLDEIEEDDESEEEELFDITQHHQRRS